MFLNIIMLAGIGGAAVPLVLHLLNRARYRSVDWGAMMFLFGDDARQRQSSRLKQLVLLMLRMALVALLAIALARPLAAARWNPAGEGSSLTAVIILDRSGSMSYDEAGHLRLDQAREAVRQILATLHRGDQAALVTLGDPGRPAPVHPTADLQSINDELAGPNFLRPGVGVASMADGLRQAADIFDRTRSANRALFVVCDRQSLNWKDINERTAAGWRTRVTVPGPTPRFFVLPVGGEEADNVAIESISVLAPEVVAGQPVDVEVTVRNYGPTPRAAIPLTLRKNQQHDPSNSVSVNLGANASTTVRESIDLHQVGSNTITARIESTGLPQDHEMSCVVDVVDPVNVLIVSGEPHRDKMLAQADYLKLALMPFSSVGRGGTDVARVQVVSPSPNEDWANFDSKKFRVVILAGVPEITPAQARALEQHVYGGGGLLVAPGGLTSIDNLNSRLFRDGAGILSAQLKSATPADASGATTILGIDLSHPVFRFLKGKPDPIPSAIVGRYFQAIPRQPDGHVLASFASGWPFVIESKFGRGKVLLVTSPLDADWGTLPLSNFYLPMVQSAVRFLASRSGRNIRPGDPITAYFENSNNFREATIYTPLGQQIRVPLQLTGDQFEARYANTQEPGIYAASIPRETLHFAVQPSREESDITPLKADRWKELSSQLGFRLVDMNTTSIAGVIGQERSEKELWPVLLAAVFVLGVVEVGLGRLWSRE